MSTAHRHSVHLLDNGICDCAGPGLMARLDPRGRILAAVLFALVTVSLSHWPALVAALGMAVALAVTARLPLRTTLKRLAALEGFMLVALAMLPFTVPGDPLGQVLGQPISIQGLGQAGIILLKANAVTLSLLALVGAIEATTLGHALGRLGVPERFVVLFLFTIRYVEVLDRELARLRLAMRARAFRARSNWHTWRSMGWLVGMLLVMSAERAERIHAAMRCRGFTGRFHMVEHEPPGALDWGFAAVHVVSVVALVVLNLP